MQKAIMQKTIVYIKENAYRIYFWCMSKDDAVNIMIGSNFIDKRGILLIFLLYIKINESAYLTYYQRTRGVILNKTEDYYENY